MASSEIQVIASSSTAEPPPYSRNGPLEDPFRDGDTSVDNFYANGNGMRKGLKAVATADAEPALPTTAVLIEPVPAEPADNALPFSHAMVFDEELSAPIPPRPFGLSRGLQIPSRVSLITWGFSFPKALPEQGVSKEQWRYFKHQLESFANLTLTQRFTVVGYSYLVGHFFGPIPGTVVSWKMTKHREHANFHQAYRAGVLKMFEERWNNVYFHPLGLHVQVVPPGIGQMDGMDVASSKLYKYQQKMGISSPAPGVASQGGDKKEYKYQVKEGRQRMKKMAKGRIIVMPYKAVDVLSVEPRMPGSESHEGQARRIAGVKAGKATLNLLD